MPAAGENCRFVIVHTLKYVIVSIVTANSEELIRLIRHNRSIVINMLYLKKSLSIQMMLL